LVIHGVAAAFNASLYCSLSFGDRSEKTVMHIFNCVDQEQTLLLVKGRTSCLHPVYSSVDILHTDCVGKPFNNVK